MTKQNQAEYRAGRKRSTNMQKPSFSPNMTKYKNKHLNQLNIVLNVTQPSFFVCACSVSITSEAIHTWREVHIWTVYSLDMLHFGAARVSGGGHRRGRRGGIRPSGARGHGGGVQHAKTRLAHTRIRINLQWKNRRIIHHSRFIV